ncbi:MAG: hypothetical protein AAGA08_15810 [Pseudomonadota bacterium]
MSEFTDFHAILTEAESLSALRGALEQVVEGAYVPLDELDEDALLDVSTMEAAWVDHSKPLWIKLGVRGTVEQLAKIGPALHLNVEEDFTSWSLDARCGDVSLSFAILRAPDIYREATAGIPVYDQSLNTKALANCLGVEDSALRATLAPNGGEPFCELLGISYEQMLDMELEDIEAGQVGFGFLAL